ncbi:MAG: hypothetical protein IJJ68_07485 [Prevotella sp.]|nr:hypothetical protein [Prevotella sp.]
MKYTDRHIYQRRSNSLLIGLLTLLWVCLSACSSGDDEANNGNQTKVPTKLYIYLYTPQTESSTRAYDGDVNPIAYENSIYKLQIWVFTHDSHKLIGYYAPEESPGLSAANPYELIQLTIDETYAETPAASRERVDVYVLANVQQENCNLTLDGNTTQAQLEEALMEKTTIDPFGVTNPVMSVPTNLGLPMSGVLRNQPVTGEAPILRLDKDGEIATVLLIRTISKIRFAFSRQTGSETLRINSIKLNGSMIPMAEYLFMSEAAPYNRKTCHIKTESGYDTTSPELLSEALEDVAVNDNPVQYAWTEGLAPIYYEQLLDNAPTSDITQRLYYLRESDQMLQGEIKYKIGNEEEKTATFKMMDVGGFSRNHVWTVYVYTAQARIQVVVAETAPWTQTDVNYEFYNW